MCTSEQGESAPRRTYVLVHGGWYGGWVWQEVAQRLRAAGHTVTAPTLTGVGERGHLADQATGLDTHIADVLAHLRMEDLNEVVQVGWSYGGMVITGVRARVPERIASMVYLDAFVPEKGVAMAEFLEPQAREAMTRLREQGRAVPPKSFEDFGVHDAALIERLAPRLTDQPVECFFQPAAEATELADTPHTYVRATGFRSAALDRFRDERRTDPRWDVVDLDVDHLLMVTNPDLTADLLARVR